MVDQARRRIEAVRQHQADGETDEIFLEIHGLLYQLVKSARRQDGEPLCDTPLDAARGAYNARRARQRIFGDRLFADPSWDIMLDLFIARLEGNQVSVSSACIGAAAPTSTALRHISHLEQVGLLSRRRHPSDARSTYIELTDEGTAKMTAFFSRLPNRDIRVA
jgi:hypothetical protein